MKTPFAFESSPNELRFPRGEQVLHLMRRFSATERVIFGILAIIAIVTALIMAWEAHNYFLTPVPARGGSFTEGVIGIPRFINPVIAVSDVERDLSSIIYAGLTRYSEGKLINDLATNYTISDDGLTYSFELDPKAEFHDGTPVTADDVEFTIQKIQDAAIKSPRRADWENVTINKIDATHIQFILKQPYAPFIENTTIGILPKHIWKNVSAEQFTFSQYNIEPIGTGPYKVSSIDRDSGGLPTAYNLSAWSRYDGKPAYISSIKINFYPTNSSLIAAYSDGSIDSMYGISAQDITAIVKNLPATKVIRSPLPIIIGIFLNQNDVPVLANKEVRQALDMAVPRERLAQDVLGGYGVIAQSPLPLTYFDRSSTTPRYNQETSVNDARAILTKAGWALNADGVMERKGKKDTETLKFDITTTSATQGLKQSAEIVASAWRALGADVQVKVFEGDLSQTIIRPRKYDALLFGEVIGKDVDLYPFWHSSQRTGFGLNIAQYVNAKADKLLEDARSTSDEKTRTEKYRAFESIVQSDIPAIFLYSPEFVYVVPQSVSGINLASMTTPTDRWNDIEHWYIRTDKVWNVLVGR